MGLIIVAIGTSLPELVISLIAAAQNETSVVAANVFGSNIANILLILGGGALLSKGLNINNLAEKSTLNDQIISLLCVSTLLIIFSYDGSFTRIEGVITLFAYAAYVLTNTNSLKDLFIGNGKKESRQNGLKVLGSGLLVGASSLLAVHSIEQISQTANIAPSLLGASILALGTSIPEIIVTWTALKKGATELAIGTLIGSCIINATLVMGLPTLFGPLAITSDILVLGVPFLLISVLLLAFTAFSGKISTFTGAVFSLIYLSFLGQTFNIL
jgi:cation:H+ antiporter